MNHGIIVQRGFYIQALICMLSLVSDVTILLISMKSFYYFVAIMIFL